MKYFVKKYIVLLLLFSSISVFGQRLRYKDIYKFVQAGDYPVAYNLLFEYQKNNPDFANTYFQLGLISYHNILEADPLLEYDRIKYFHYNVRLFWGLAKKFITEDNTEVTRNRKYYQNVPELAKIKRLTAPDVLDFINSRLRKSDEVVAEEGKIHDIFYKMVSDYTQSVEYYRGIVARYNKLKDIYLAPVQEIFPQLDTLRMLFDSSLYMYQQYKAAIASFPIKKYNQQLRFEDIRLYRLDGITNTDFLSDTILFWNYGVWIKQVKKVINTDIKNLRETIEREYVNLTAAEKKLLSATDYSDDYQGYYLLQRVIFQIEKYDLNSLASAILKYKKAKTDFLAFRRHKFNDTQDSTIKFVVRANDYYRELIMLGKLDSLLADIHILATPENIKKHQAFVQHFFPQGLEAYVSNERTLLNRLFSADLQHYKYFLFRDILNYPFVKKTVDYKGDTICLYPSGDSLNPYITFDYVRDPLGNIFAAGVKKNTTKQMPFVIKVTSGILQWFDPVKIKQLASVNSMKLLAYTDGVIAIVNYTLSDGQRGNYIISYDQFGKKRLSFDAGIDKTPVFADFDDINNILILAYKGYQRKKFDTYDTDTLVIQKWNLDSLYLHWQKEFAITGNLTNILRFDTTYYAFVNYKTIKSVDDNSISHLSQENSVGALKITASGKVLSFKERLLNTPLYMLYAYKLTSKKINVLGFDGQPFDLNQRDYQALPPLKSFIINKF